MDEPCNFPELLALDLETAEPVFASKRMTAGTPRPMDVIFESKSIQDLVEARILSTEDALAYSAARNLLSSKAFADFQAHTDAMARLSQPQVRSRSKSTPHAAPPFVEDELPQLRPATAVGAGNGPGDIAVPRSEVSSSGLPLNASKAAHGTSEWDTDSVDSFELPNISLSRRSGSVREPRPTLQLKEEQLEQQQKLEQQTSRERKPSVDETGPRLFPQGGDRGGGSSFRDSRDSYGSLYDSYGYTDDLDDSASASSYGISVPSSARGRQQSVVTTATSVTSSGCRFSSQSRTLSAMGPSSPKATQRESVASCDRRVEFNLEEDIIDDAFRRDGSSSESRSNRSSRNSQKSSSKAASEATDHTEASDAAAGRALAAKATEQDRRAGQRGTGSAARSDINDSSWMIFDDHEEDGEESVKVPLSFLDDTAVGAFERSRGHSLSNGSLPPRPKTSMGHSRSEKTDSSAMPDWAARKRRLSRAGSASVTPATFIAVPKRRSSLSHQVALETLDRTAVNLQQYEQHPYAHEPRQLGRLPSFGGASVSGDALAGVLPPGHFSSVSSHVRRDLRAAERPLSPSTLTASDGGEPPVLLPRTVYRKPIPEPLHLHPATSTHSVFKASRGHDWSKKEMASVKEAVSPKDQTSWGREIMSSSRADHGGRGHGRSRQKASAKPLLVSQFDDDSDSDLDAGGSEKGVDLFRDFEGAYNCDEDEDKFLMTAAMPSSRQQPPRSLRSGRSMPSLSQAVRRPAFRADNVEETTTSLQSWIEYTSRSQEALVQAPSAGVSAHGHQNQLRSREQSMFYEEDESEETQLGQTALTPIPHDSNLVSNGSSNYHQLQESLQQSLPLASFYQSGIVGIPLPREVVDTLRVSVSCFPETMLSLSSFSIQTIRSYSRKVRRGSQSDADSTYRLLISPRSPTGFPPSPTSVTPFVPPLLPPSPTTATLPGGSIDLGTGVARTLTGSTSSSRSPRRFWQLPKKLAHSRTSPNLGMFSSSRPPGHGYAAASTGPANTSLSSGRHGSHHDDQTRSSAEEDLGKGGGMCFKRIFPTGSDYLCDALYAHIIAFNYIGLLCPPPGAAASAGPASADEHQLTTAAHTMTTSTLSESSSQQQKRQTIRVYVASDVPLPSLSDFEFQEHDTPLSLTRLENSTMLLSSPSSTPPPSRGRGDDDNLMISRKAALLLGISETLEPDSHKSTGASGAEASGSRSSSSRSHRYNSLRRRHLRRGSSASEATTVESISSRAAAASKMFKKALPGNKAPFGISRPIYETDTIAAAAAAAAAAEGMPGAGATAFAQPSPAPEPTAAAHGIAAASDASMRDLHAGLHACISQLVATMKLTTGQLGNTLLNTDVARDIDPLFLRTLCELVRSQEEQF